jgi:ubiquitin-conjugating enzyme E2 R
LLNEPNTYSAANVDASVLYRKWRDSRGKDKQYSDVIRKQVETSLKEAEKDGVTVPQTLEEYTAIVQKHVPNNSTSEVDDMLDYDEDYIESSSDEDLMDGADVEDDMDDDDDANFYDVDSGTA